MIRGREDTYFTISELAAMADVSPKTVMNWLAEGVIKAVTLGRRRFIPLSSIEASLGRTKRIGPSVSPKQVEEQLAFVRRDLRS